MPTAPDAWVTPTILQCPGVVRTIRLEPLEKWHAPDLFAAADPELFTHTSQAPAEWSVRGFETEFATIKAMPDVVAFAIVLFGPGGGGEHAGRAIGRTTFMDIMPDHRCVEIGRTWIGRAYHGTRVNPEAKYLMLRHAFQVISPPAIRVQITTTATNLHSQAAIAKLGAVREGVLRKARIMPASISRPAPAVRDVEISSILDEEWPRVKAQLERRLMSME